MTDERKKLSLKKPDQAPTDGSDTAGDTLRRKTPVRGPGSAPRKRMTAAEAAQAREEAAARAALPPPAQEERPPRAQRGPYEAARQERQNEQHAPRAARNDRPASAPRRDDPRAQTRYPDDRPRPPGRSPHANSDPRRSDGPRGSDRPRQQPPRPSPAAERRPAAPIAPPREEDGRIRLSKLMSEQGLASRREADEWIEQGWVRVDGEVISELGSRVFPDQVITIDKLASTQQAQRVTVLINKPIGYVSGQAEDGHEPAYTLVLPENRWKDDTLPLQLTRGHLRNLAPAGRLDIDSTGLLVLTQDGRIAKHLIGEDSGVEKEYLVRVEYLDAPGAEDVSAHVPPEVLEQLRFGLELDGRQLKPAQVSWQNEHQLRFVLREGRKRQIRRMCELVGLKVVGLKRVRMGRITLGKLPVGQWRFLRPDERF